MYQPSKRLLQLAWDFEQHDDAFAPPAPIMPPVPARTFEDELSALCDALLEGPDAAGALAGALPQSPGVPGDSNAAASCLSATEAADDAALDILEQFSEEKERGGQDGECDDFDETKVFEPKQHHIDHLNATIREESRKWLDAHATEKAERAVFERSPMQVLWDRKRNHRGCARGACCVYSMWYDPAFGGHGNCTHKCTVSPGAVARCGPSLFALDLPPLDYPGDFGGNTDRTVRRPPASYNLARKSTRRLLRKLGKTSHSVEQTPVSSHATCNHHSLAIVAPTAPVPTPRGSKRTRKNMSPVSRVRKRLGQRSFGKLKNGPKVLPELSSIVAANYS